MKIRPVGAELFNADGRTDIKIGSKMYIVLHVKYPLFLSDFNGT